MLPWRGIEGLHVAMERDRGTKCCHGEGQRGPHVAMERGRGTTYRHGEGLVRYHGDHSYQAEPLLWKGQHVARRRGQMLPGTLASVYRYRGWVPALTHGYARCGMGTRP